MCFGTDQVLHDIATAPPTPGRGSDTTVVLKTITPAACPTLRRSTLALK